MILALMLMLGGPAMADDDPWGPLEIDEDDDPWGPLEPDAPSPSDSPWQSPSEPAPASDEPWGELEPDEPTAIPDLLDPVAAAPQPAVSPEAQPVRPRPTVTADGGQVPWGYRIGAVGGGSTVRMVQKSLVGPDGGSHATVLDASWSFERMTATIGLPFATYRTPGGRTTDVGNMQIGLARLLDGQSGKYTSSIGVEGHFNVGERAYTWINEAGEVWPGAGVEIVYNGRVDGDWSLLYRASVGAAGAAEFAPFPSWYVRVAAAAGIDRSITDEVGVTAEMSVAYWDPSPWEVSGLVRADIVDGLRLRGGVVLPVSSWVGWVPASRDAGVREATVVVDLSLAL
jgi:hypothetical protein